MFKNEKSIIVFLSLSLFNFVFFTIAIFGIGFKIKGENTLNIIDIQKQLKIFNLLGIYFVRNSYKLIISSLFLNFAIIILLLITISVSFTLKVEEIRNIDKYLYLIWIALTILTVILISAGELNYMIKMYQWAFVTTENSKKFSNYWDISFMALMITFSFLPIIFLLTPFLISKRKKKKSLISITHSKKPIL